MLFEVSTLTIPLQTNAKCSIILAFNSLIIGALLFKFDEIVKIYNQNLCFEEISIFLLVLIGLLSPISIIFAFRGINPLLKSGEEGSKYRSMIFFGSVSKMQLQEYMKKINSVTDAEIIEDLIRQAKVLADSLAQKMNDMRKAIQFLYGILFLIMALVVLKGALLYGF